MDFKHFQCSLKSCFDKGIFPQEKLIRILGDHNAFIEMTISDLKSAKGSNFWVLSVQKLVLRGQCLRKRSAGGPFFCFIFGLVCHHHSHVSTITVFLHQFFRHSTAPEVDMLYYTRDQTILLFHFWMSVPSLLPSQSRQYYYNVLAPNALLHRSIRNA